MITDLCTKARHEECSEKDCPCGCHTESCPPHAPHRLGIQLSGPKPPGLSMEHIHVKACIKCRMVYWESLPDTPIKPKIFMKGGNGGNA